MLIKRDKYSLGESVITNITSEKTELKLDLKISLNNKNILMGSIISGIVLDSNNKPVKNAIIKLMDEKLQPLIHGYTDSSGKYMIDTIPQSVKYNIMVISTGKLISKLYNLTILNNEIKNLNFNLENDFNSILGVISGKVLKDTNYSSGIYGAVIFLYNNSKLIAITYSNSDGEFLLGELEPGNYEILISALGYIFYKTKIIVESGKISTIKGYLSEDKTISNAIISGIITDDKNLGVYTANVILYKINSDNTLIPVAFTNTNESGIYTFFNVPIGKYIVKSNKYEALNLDNSGVSINTIPSTTIPSSSAIVKNTTIPIYSYNAVNGILSNGAIKESGTNFAGWIGGSNDGATTVKVEVPYDGTYNLEISYLGADANRNLKIDINGINTGKVYTPMKTNGWTIGDAKKFNLFIKLRAGENIIKFHGDGMNYGPSLEKINLRLISKTENTIYDISKGILSNGAKINNNNNFVTYIGGVQNGAVTINVNVLENGLYNGSIQYLSIGNNMSFKVDINGLNTGIAYTPEKTNSFDIMDSKVFNFSINLKSGNNTIKFYGDGINNTPDLRLFSLTYMIKDDLPEYDIDISDNWKFNLGDILGSEKISFDDYAWRDIDIPHDWSIELDFNKDSPATHEGGYLDGGMAWYRKILLLNESMNNKKIIINFEGVYMESKTYVNGVLVGEHQQGFTPFSFDITDKLKFNGNANIIAVQVTNKQPSCRWYSGSGIYRKVSLIILDFIYVEKYGISIFTPTLEEDLKNNKDANVNIKLNVQNNKTTNENVKIKLSIYSPNNILVTSYEKLENISRGLNKLNYDLYVKKPLLWDIYLGNVYKAIVEVIVNGVVLNKYKTRFGFRYFNFDANKGFSLNGKYMKIKGVCMHDDRGALGVEENYDATLRQVKILKNMGINAIRTSHNPRSQMFIELCEDEGILVKEEAFDCWKLSKKPYDYARFFNQYAKRDLQIMMNRDKNSPSIIIWSLGNEIDDTGTAEGVNIVQNLISWAKEIDSTRPITIGDNKPSSNYSNSVWNLLDLAGYNYGESYYDTHHSKYPNRKIFGSETSSAVRSRGVYLDPNNSNIIDWNNLQVSSYDNSVVSWGRSAEDSLKQDRDRQFVAGQFIWTGFDYIGEPTPFYNSYPAKSSYFGIIDTAGFEKDVYYLYQSQWTTKPMVHLLPHWNWNDGQNIKVWAYSNVDTVELFLNGVSLGERKFENKITNYGVNYLETINGKLHLEWNVPFKPGTLKAIAKKNGNVVAEDIVMTAGTPYGFKLVSDKDSLIADGKSLAFISIYVIDSKGVIVPTANNNIDFVVNGGSLVGLDNGNAASVERYKDVTRKAFNGKALAIIKSDEYTGNITLTVSSSGLNSQSISIIKK